MALVFSPEGKRLATPSNSQNTVKVWDAASGREILALKGHTRGVWSVALTPDGKRLVSSSSDGTIKIWDASKSVTDSAEGCNNLAWLLATSAEAKLRCARARALKLARKAVELAPKEGNFWNTLGAAHYRTGDWNAAIEALHKSMELRQGGDSLDRFFLAMAHWQLGQKGEAHKWYDQAALWMEKHAPQHEESRRFRAEAAELLGIKTKEPQDGSPEPSSGRVGRPSYLKTTKRP